jgi:hypothetical protein
MAAMLAPETVVPQCDREDMSELAWITSHVERLLQDEWDVCRVSTDCDGDYFYRVGTAACWVSIMPAEPVMVRVFAHAATGIRPSLKLFTELNEIGRRALSATIVLEARTVVVSQTISPIGLTRPVLAQAMRSVAGVADDVGLLLAGMFGGATPFPAETCAASEDAP